MYKDDIEGKNGSNKNLTKFKNIFLATVIEQFGSKYIYRCF